MTLAILPRGGRSQWTDALNPGRHRRGLVTSPDGNAAAGELGAHACDRGMCRRLRGPILALRAPRSAEGDQVSGQDGLIGEQFIGLDDRAAYQVALGGGDSQFTCGYQI